MNNLTMNVREGYETTYLTEAPPTLAEAQALVGGYIERLVLQSLKGIMLVDEEGRLKHLPVNHEATAMAGQPIFGSVVVLSGKARKGWR